MGRISKYSQIEIALYKGDEFIMSGKINKVAEAIGVQASTLYYYTMPAYLKKLTKFKKATSGQNVRRVIRLDKDDEDES